MIVCGRIYSIDSMRFRSNYRRHTAVIAVFRYLPFNVPVQRRRSSVARCNRLSGVIVSLAPEYDMGGFLRRDELNAFVPQCARVDPLEQSLSPAQ